MIEWAARHAKRLTFAVLVVAWYSSVRVAVSFSNDDAVGGRLFAYVVVSTLSLPLWLVLGARLGESLGSRCLMRGRGD